MSGNYSAWDIEPLDPVTAGNEELLYNMVGWAVLAPSSHNSQPWRFVINPEEMTIGVRLSEDSVLRYSDKVGRQATISLGCAVANMLTVAEAYGIAYHLNYCRYSAEITFYRTSKTGLLDREPFEVMKRRRMNRSKFQLLRPIPDSVIKTMEDIALSQRVGLSLITDNITKIGISEMQYTANRAVIILNDFRYELARYFLPNDTDKSIGMPGNTFGLSDEMARYAHDELAKKGSFDPDLAFGMAASDRDGIKSSPLIGVITVEKDDFASRLQAGISFGRIALLAEAKGLAVAVHAAIVEVEMFSTTLMIRLKTKQKPVVLFRVGYATEERPHSPRLTAHEVSQLKGGSGGLKTGG